MTIPLYRKPRGVRVSEALVAPQRHSPRTKPRFAWLGRATLIAAIFGIASIPGPTRAADGRGNIMCLVPSAAYPTLESAIADTGCDEAVLASGSYVGTFLVGRSLKIVGPTDFSAHLLGGLLIQGDGNVEVNLQYVQIDNDPTAGALFSDGFETGDTSAWSSSSR